MKKAFITGISGQDGSYLAEYLLELGYEVYGIVRRHSVAENQQYRLEKIRNHKNLHVTYGDLLDQTSIEKALTDIKPDEIYNLAAQSHVRISFDIPQFTVQTNSVGVVNILEAYKRICPTAKFYQASSSEMFGKVTETPQRETTRFHPRSPYGVAKVYGHYITLNYRESYDMFACSGILFNHESPRRGIEFVTRKITNAVARISLGKQDKLELGNLDAERDWGFAGDYVQAMWLMLQQEEPDDYVIATGEKHSVEEFVRLAFEVVGISDWKQYVVSDHPKHTRPAEVDYLIGDYSKAKEKLGWEPKTSFSDLVTMMVNSDLEKEKNNK